jgi:hypothetical protein
VDDRTVENYRGYELVAAAMGSKYLGKVWKGSDAVLELEGGSLPDVLAKLRAAVGARLNDLAEKGGGRDVAEYEAALRRILPSLSDGHLAMIKAHYRAPNQSLTATQLADAAMYAGYRGVNLQYGFVGKRLWEELPTPLPADEQGEPIYTFALADAGDRSTPKDQWIWKLKPQLADAIRLLGLND